MMRSTKTFGRRATGRIRLLEAHRNSLLVWHSMMLGLLKEIYFVILGLSFLGLHRGLN